MTDDNGREPVAASTPEERIANGRAARARVQRSTHGEWTPPADRRSVVDQLAEQETTRVQSLVPIRHERMAVSPFTFYRGAANVMAADLSGEPDTGLQVQLCGDAHLANFGGFATPERTLIFDINDFDETLPGPFEWDLKRLAASFEVAGRSNEFSDRERRTVLNAMTLSYVRAMHEFSLMSNLDIWYTRLTTDDLAKRWGTGKPEALLANFRRLVAKAETKDRLKAMNKLTTVTDGESGSGAILRCCNRCRRSSRRRSNRSCTTRWSIPSPPTAAPSNRTGVPCSSGTGSSTWPGRWSASAASGRGVGSR